MTQDEFVATLILIKFTTNTKHRYTRGLDTVTLYSTSAITTISGISNYHKSYKDAVKRLSKTSDV